MEKENDNKIKQDQDLAENKESEVISENQEITEPSTEERLKDTRDKLLRALAETENQRRRFEKETKEAFEYGGFNLARETLSVLDNLQRAYLAIKNDETLKDNKDLNKFLENIKIVEKDLVTIFEKNNIKKITRLNFLQHYSRFNIFIFRFQHSLVIIRIKFLIKTVNFFYIILFKNSYQIFFNYLNIF